MDSTRPHGISRRYHAPMFLIPTGTDRDNGHRAIVVPLLLLSCVAVFLLTRGGDQLESYQFSVRYGISYRYFEWWQPITSQFLHGGWFHLIMNCFFLLAFGVVLEARLGQLGFLALYLAGGCVAGFAQMYIGYWMDPSHAGVPAIGASGSVSALMGAVFALHPRANIRGYSIPQFAPAMVSMKWMIAFAVAVDIIRTMRGGSGIATLAHLGGLAFGFGIGMALLGSGILKRNDFDVLFIFKQWRRRRELREAIDAVGGGHAGGPIAARVASGGDFEETTGQRALRATIASAHRERDYTLAAKLYVELTASLPDATLPADIQLDVANELARSARNADAARAYGRFLERFRTHPAADDARLMLATIFMRRLGDRAAAAATLAGFGKRELDRDRAAMLAALRSECASAPA